MQVHCRHLSLIVGLSLLSLAGCYSYSPYGYGYPTGPQFYPPGGTMPPAGSPQLGPATQTPQGAYLPPSGTPSTASAGSAWQAPKPTSPGSPSTASGYGSSPNEFDQPAKSQPVPEPRDPRPSTQNSTTEPTEDFLKEPKPVGANDAGVKLQGIEGDMMTSTGVNSDAGLTGRIMLTESDTEDFSTSAKFETPVSFRPTASTSTSVSDPSPTTRPNPYKYDRKGYAWLRGVVDYDENDQAWHIIYSLNPDTSDAYGGDITLVDSPELNTLRNEDVVYVEGRVDESQRDRLGKPCYRVDRCMPLVPENKS